MLSSSTYKRQLCTCTPLRHVLNCRKHGHKENGRSTLPRLPSPPFLTFRLSLSVRKRKIVRMIASETVRTTRSGMNDSSPYGSVHARDQGDEIKLISGRSQRKRTGVMEGDEKERTYTNDDRLGHYTLLLSVYRYYTVPACHKKRSHTHSAIPALCRNS